jgi:glycerate 2-kinase
MTMNKTPTLINIVEKIWKAGLEGVASNRLIHNSLKIQGNTLNIADHHSAKKIIDLTSYEDIHVIAFGKAAPGMAAALLEVLNGRIRAGIVVALPGANVALPALRVIEAPHPLPDERSCVAAREILALAQSAKEKDLVLVLISGGGSAQVALPLPGTALADKTRIAQELMLRGADIIDLNIVRKHLSAIKGGRLAEAAFPAEVVNIVISDVIGDDLETIASGVSYWDSSTYTDARQVLEKFAVWDEAHASVRRVIENGRAGHIPETPKKGDAAFERVSSFIIGNNALALEAARLKAEELGFKTLVAASPDRGEARLAAKSYADRLLDFAASGIPASGKDRGRPLCVLGGGELTVNVKGAGLGGRNQEFVLAVLSELARSNRASELNDLDWLVASLGTDGIDGNTEAAGAWISPQNLQRVRELRLDIQSYLDNNDSHRFFSRAGGLIITGPTGTNVMDLRVMCIS